MKAERRRTQIELRIQKAKTKRTQNTYEITEIITSQNNKIDRTHEITEINQVTEHRRNHKTTETTNITEKCKKQKLIEILNSQKSKKKHNELQKS